jgi:hypothetical protein
MLQFRQYCSEQVGEEGPLEVSLVEDEAHKANHGNAAQGHLKLQGQADESSQATKYRSVSGSLALSQGPNGPIDQSNDLPMGGSCAVLQPTPGRFWGWPISQLSIGQMQPVSCMQGSAA